MFLQALSPLSLFISLLTAIKTLMVDHPPLSSTPAEYRAVFVVGESVCRDGSSTAPGI